jgi:hypothetical protein
MFAWSAFCMMRVRDVVAPGAAVIVTAREAQIAEAVPAGQAAAYAEPWKVIWPAGSPLMAKLVGPPAFTVVAFSIGTLAPAGVASRTMQPTPVGTEVSSMRTSA